MVSHRDLFFGTIHLDFLEATLGSFVKITVLHCDL
jgi:hypothetical protein